MTIKKLILLLFYLFSCYQLQSAKLYFYFSTMNAGKTTNLLQTDYNYKERGMKTLLFKSIVDTRHKLGLIKSRIGIEAQGIAIDKNFNFYNYLVEHIKKNECHCILIDEAQFLNKKQVYQLCEIVDKLKIPVVWVQYI